MRILRIIRIFVIFSSVFEEHIDLFVRALYDRILRSTQEDHPDTTNGRRPGAIRELERFFFFRPEWIRRFPGISAWEAIFYLHIPTYTRCFVFLHGAQRQTTLARSALGVQTTDRRKTTTPAVQRAWYDQLATMLRDVLYCSQLLLSDPWIRHRG